MKRYITCSTNRYDQFKEFRHNGNKYSVHYSSFDTDIVEGTEFVDSLNISMSPIHPYDLAEYPWAVVKNGMIYVYQRNGLTFTQARTYTLLEDVIPDDVYLWDMMDDNWNVIYDDHDAFYYKQFESVLNYMAELIEKYSEDIDPNIDRS